MFCRSRISFHPFISGSLLSHHLRDNNIYFNPLTNHRETLSHTRKAGTRELTEQFLTGSRFTIKEEGGELRGQRAKRRAMRSRGTSSHVPLLPQIGVTGMG
jgi:hypothetical protein